jgi:RNA polymerase sigma factor (sigma-70 family)
MDIIKTVTAAKSGDSKAFEDLFLEYQNEVYYICLKFTRNEDDAADMLQDTFVTAFTKLSTLDKPDAFGSWIKNIAANKCRDLLKAKKPLLFSQTENEEGEDVAYDIEDEDESSYPDKALDNAESRRLVDDMVNRLPDLQRITVILYYFNEMNIQDIAAQMGCSEGTVKSRLNYARKQIKADTLELEKKGVKLYSSAVLPLLGFLLHGAARNTLAPASVTAATVAAAAGSAAKSGVAAASASTVNSAAGFTKKAAKFAVQGTMKKAIAGTVAAVLIGGGAFGVSLLTDKKTENSVSESTSNVVHIISSADTSEAQSDSNVSSISNGNTASTTSESDNKFIPDYTDPSQINKYGNSTGNINNRGFAAIQGDWIYYSVNNKLYKMKTDGTSKTMIYNGKCEYINVVGDWIYFHQSGDGKRISKIRTDGSAFTCIGNDSCSSLLVVDDWIFYTFNKKIIKMRIDGSERTVFGNDAWSCLNIHENTIYYKGNSKIYQIGIDGTNEKLISKEAGDYLSIFENEFYYSNGWGIHKMKLDGSEHVELSNTGNSDLIITKGYIYFSNWNDGYKLYCIRADGTDKRKLNDLSSSDINIVGDWIFYIATIDNRNYLYKMRLDGSDNQLSEG